MSSRKKKVSETSNSTSSSSDSDGSPASKTSTNKRKKVDDKRTKQNSNAEVEDSDKTKHSPVFSKRSRNESAEREHRSHRKSEGDRHYERDRHHERDRNDDRRDRRYDRNEQRVNNSRDNYRRDNQRGFNQRDRGRGGGQNFDRRDNRNFRNRGNRRRSRSGSFDHGNAKWGKSDDKANSDKKRPEDREKPNFGLSGKLTEETNTYKGVLVKYSEPPEARKPRRRWRLYPFKGEKALQTLYIHRESAYLIGRERKVVDLPVDHPSCSKQHAALQYRLVPFTRDDGSSGKRVRPYIIDLESANGTFINNKKIDAKKYVELLERDVIKFGFSSREYVLLHENSKDEAMDDDVKQETEDVPPEVPVKEELQE